MKSRKGITPIVAIVLLMGVTVAGSYSVYELYNKAQNTAKSYDRDIQLSTNSLSVESCWGTPSDPRMSVRSEASEAFNATLIPIRINGSLIKRSEDEYNITNNIVDPQETFTIKFNISKDLSEDARISLMTSSETVRYQCLNLN